MIHEESEDRTACLETLFADKGIARRRASWEFEGGRD